MLSAAATRAPAPIARLENVVGSRTPIDLLAHGAWFYTMPKPVGESPGAGGRDTDGTGGT
jgi:hypothetical protein